MPSVFISFITSVENITIHVKCVYHVLSFASISFSPGQNVKCLMFCCCTGSFYSASLNCDVTPFRLEITFTVWQGQSLHFLQYANLYWLYWLTRFNFCCHLTNALSGFIIELIHGLLLYVIGDIKMYLKKGLLWN